MKSVFAFCSLVGLFAVSASPSLADTKPRYPAWHNHYKDSFVTKVFMRHCHAKGNTTNLDQVREMIRNAWEISGGMHQVIYLVGTSFKGLDSGYPCWTNVNESCTSELSPDRVTALRMAMREAHQKYNCDLSLHLNVSDVHEDCPDWKRYVDMNLLAKDANGNFKRGLWWCQNSHYKDWHRGFARAHVDALLEMLPELKDSKTVHFDAMFARASEKDGITLEQDKEAIRLFTDYWHSKGIDVTTEFITSEDMIGPHPMIWHNNMDEWQRLQFPPDLVCGGDDEWNGRFKIDYYHRNQPTPFYGCRYEEAWGRGHWGDMNPNDLDRSRMIRQLFKTAFLFAWYNRNRPIAVNMTADDYRVTRTGGVEANVRIRDRYLTVTENGRTVVDGTDYFLDMPYGGGTLLVHSLKGCDRTFRLPPSWKGCTRLEGKRHPARQDAVLVPDAQGEVRVKLSAGESLMLRRK